jgi:hypothetical protein
MCSRRRDFSFESLLLFESAAQFRVVPGRAETSDFSSRLTNVVRGIPKALQKVRSSMMSSRRSPRSHLLTKAGIHGEVLLTALGSRPVQCRIFKPAESLKPAFSLAQALRGGLRIRNRPM